jgi:hypothetical protein
MYVGVYRLPDDDDPVMTCRFAKDSDFSMESRMAMANFFVTATASRVNRTQNLTSRKQNDCVLFQ